MRFVIGSLLTTLLALFALSTPAAADKKCRAVTTTIIVNGVPTTTVETVCTKPGGRNDTNTSDGGDGSSGCKANGKTIPCTTPGGGYWFDSQYCYAYDVSATMPADAWPEYWQGNTDGALYACQGYGPDMIDVGSAAFFWVSPEQVPALVDPTVLAQRALDQMALARPNVHLAPTPPDMTYVGLDTWLWMDQGQFDDLTNTVSAGSASVTVTASPVRSSWDMGDGSGTSCPGPGRRWVRGMTSAERTNCSYAYDRVSDFESGGKFTATASLVYQVDWTCAGPCLAREGSLGEVDGPASSTAIRVGERQTVVTNRGGRNS